ncbi:MAG TPA: ATPase, partial [Planctomycetaceae bacterium]|nr:ATPase [Planctomycetaceae bacterium]
QSGAGFNPAPPTTARPVMGSGGGSVHDLYSDLFTRSQRSSEMPSPAAPTAPPRQPNTLADSGLTLGFLSELVLKLLYVHGSLLGQDIAHQIRLVFPIVDEALRFLKDQRCIEVSSGELVGRVSYRFALTELGRLRAREVFEQCRYVGPAPVAMEQYVAQSRRQTVTGLPCTPAALKQAFQDFILRPGLVDELGPAVCTGRSIFVYGPPGNGKTVIAKGLGRYLNAFGGEIYVPYALLAENTIITVYDPVLHQTTDDGDLARRGVIPRTAATAEAGTVSAPESSIDLRWRRIRRPVIITGGELTLEMLELQHHKVGNFYNAPLHIKANGGVFLIDDFGRQLVSPRDLLNRWIVPLEERIDYLTLTTGRKFALPFEQLIIFSTNLDPKDLVDDAFLRRIRYKVRVDPPTREVFQQIFDAACQQRGLPSGTAVVEHLFQTYYDHGRPPRSSDPRDLLDLVQAECRFHGRPVEWSEALIAHTAQRLFHQM